MRGGSSLDGEAKSEEWIGLSLSHASSEANTGTSVSHRSVCGLAACVILSKFPSLESIYAAACLVLDHLC